MVSGKHKSKKRFRQVYVRTPGAKNVIHYRVHKANIAKCAVCKKELNGIPALLPGKQKNTPKSMKTVERPFGGNLCSKCSRDKIKEYARGLEE